MRFVGLLLHEPVPDAKTIWLYREQLVRAGALKRVFARFDRVLREKAPDFLSFCLTRNRSPRSTQKLGQCNSAFERCLLLQCSAKAFRSA